jgi:predicted RNA-binding Zn ribbon-like protein
MAPPSEVNEHEFRLGLGHAALEFVATLGRRHAVPVEQLAGPADLNRWLEAAGIASGAVCDRMLLMRARELREAIYRIVVVAREGRAPARADLELVNNWARGRLRTPQLDDALHMTLIGPDPCHAALTQVARSAIELVAGPELPRIRNCGDPSCSLMFIDHSRPGRRRWCSMERCGNRAKTASYRKRRRTPPRA